MSAVTVLFAIYAACIGALAGLLAGFMLGLRLGRHQGYTRSTVERSQRRRRAVEALRDAHEYPPLRPVDGDAS